MSNNSTPDIFLSYSWANADVADQIDNDFKRIGITFRRDVRDATYRTSIKDFMHQIGKTDFVLMLISDEYLRSENCLYEVTELLNTHEFEKRILPIVLDNARYIFNATERKVYYDYWNQKRDEAEQLKIKYANLDYVEHARKYVHIVNHLDVFFQKLTYINVSTFEALKKEHYRPMLKLIGFEDMPLLEEVLAIQNMTDPEEKELALEAFLSIHPHNKNGLFLKAHLAQIAKQYKNAKQYYNELIIKYPAFAIAHYNLGILLNNAFSDYSGACRHYKEAIRLNPQDGFAHNNLGNLLVLRFSDYAGARHHFEEALQLDPRDSFAHHNLGKLLENHFSAYAKARHHYEVALRLEPKYADAHNSLGMLLERYFSDYDGALHHFKEVLRLNPEDTKTHYNLGNLLVLHLSDYAGARYHYEAALRLTPKDANTHYNLGNLLALRFSDYAGARYHFEETLRLNPQHAGAHNNLGILLKKYF